MITLIVITYIGFGFFAYIEQFFISLRRREFLNFLDTKNLMKEIHTFDRVMIATALYKFGFLVCFLLLLFNLFFVKIQLEFWFGVAFIVLVVLFLTLTFLITGILVLKSNIEKFENPWKQLMNLLFYVPLFPATEAVKLIFVAINKLSGTDNYRFNLDLSEDILKSLIETESELEVEEREMLTSIFEFGDTKVSEIMIPRIEIAAVDEEEDISEVLKIILDQGYSRIPIYKESIDEIIGIVYAKDILIEFHSKGNLPKLKDISRKKVYFIPESARIDDLLKTLRDEKLQIAVALDEYGGTAGLVTLEDIVEEIFGEIEDEYDKKKSKIEKLKDGTLLFQAQIDIEEIFKQLEIDPPEIEGVESIGGYVLNHLGKIPRVGDKIKIKNLIFEIIEADERKIIKMKISKKGKK